MYWNALERGENMKIKFDTTLERDMDLLIMEEFISSPEFAGIFLDVLGIHGDYVIEEAAHSVRDPELGESDLVFVLKVGGTRHAVHIEDKIDAQAMPEQHSRYTLRAEKDVLAGKYDTFSVMIAAPEKYLSSNKEAEKYENQVTYERIRAYFCEKDDLRSNYKLALIDRAIHEQKSGYQREANSGVVRFCDAMDTFQREHYPNLPAGTQAWWRHYPTLLPGTVLVYKSNKGFCDLQFDNCTPQVLYLRVKDCISRHMTIVKTGKSASVRITVHPVWFEKDFEDKVSEAAEALGALSELYELSKRLMEP